MLKEWSQGHVDKLIAEKKLAPKQIDETNSRDAECPICFMVRLTRNIYITIVIVNSVALSVPLANIN